jgi:hypothetical protein
MISESELRDRSIVFQNSRNVAAELLKTLKRDVPFETEQDILEAHDRLTNALYEQYCVFREKTINPTDTPANQAEIPKDAPATPTEPKREAPKAELAPKTVATSEPAVLAMVQKAVDAVSTRDACEELKAKILKATKLSLQDQSELIAKLEAKAKAL